MAQNLPDRQSDYFPPPDPRFDSLRDLQKRNSPEARWALQVHLRPDGLAHYLQGLQTRNAILVSLLLGLDVGRDRAGFSIRWSGFYRRG